MKAAITLVSVFIFSCSAYSQNLDLIVTADRDSIACEIINVTDSEIVFKINKNVQTYISREDISRFEYDVIQEDLYRYKPGTPYIIGKVYTISPDTYYQISSGTYSFENLQKSSEEEYEYYRFKAKKLKKTGGILTCIGVGSTVLGYALFSGAWSGNLGGPGIADLGLIMMIGGPVVTIIGLPLLISGSIRVKKINKFENQSLSNIDIRFKPKIQYNQITQNYQPGFTFSISF